MRSRLTRYVSSLEASRQRMTQRISAADSGQLMRTGECRLNRCRATLAAMPGAAHGVTYPGATTPALAKLVSSATAPCRSKTVTSCPSAASSYAVVTPTMPAPMTATFNASGSLRRRGSCAARRAQRRFGRESQVEEGVVAQGAVPQHQADRQGARSVARQRDGAAVEHVDHAGVAQQERVDPEERVIALRARRDLGD